MAIDYTEKRNYFRMNLDCNAEYVINGSGQSKNGKVTNLSGDGISLIADQSVDPGTEIKICITPVNDVTPPLDVVMEVLRCEPHDAASYLLAGSISRG